MYIPVCVILSADRPKNSRSPGCNALFSTVTTPSHRACGPESLGIRTPRRRHSICVNPEQSYPKLDVPPHR